MSCWISRASASGCRSPIVTTAPRACCVTLKRSWAGRKSIAAAAFSFCRLTRFISCALVEQQPELVSQAAHALLIPDYFSFRLTGNLNWEYTNATTTQLVNINSDSWDETLLNWTGAPLAWFGKPTHPGNVIGHWICPQGNRIPVVAVASHDTASAVIASPLADRHAAYLSSGTWSLMGFESLTPYTCDAALQANITNEGGAEGRYRVLKNIMGLWLLQRVLKSKTSATCRG